MKFIQFIIIFTFLSIFIGCSSTTVYSVLKNKKSRDWDKTITCEHCESFAWFGSYDYKYNKLTRENLTISVCPCLFGYNLSFGPLLIPVFPNPGLIFMHHRIKYSSFYVDLLFQEFKTKTINLESIHFIFGKKNIEIIPDSINPIYQHNNERKYLYRSSHDTINEQVIGKTYKMEGDTVRLRFYFRMAVNKVKRLMIDLSHINVNDSVIPFSKISYVRGSRILYDPVYIGH